MPVKDADLKQVSSFKNLQKLNLSFTDITGKGLTELTPLEQLKTLSLSGTIVRYADLQKLIGQFKNLKTLSLWKTELTTAQIAQLQKANAKIQIIAGFDGATSEPIRLNPPQLKNSSAIFSQSLACSLNTPLKAYRSATQPTEQSLTASTRRYLRIRRYSINLRLSRRRPTRRVVREYGRQFRFI